MTETKPANDNGNGSKAPSAIQAAHDRWVKNGAKKPDAKALAACKKALIDAENGIAEAQAMVEKARDARHAASIAAIELCGSKTALDLGKGFGTRVPAGQHERVFYRNRGEVDTL